MDAERQMTAKAGKLKAPANARSAARFSVVAAVFAVLCAACAFWTLILVVRRSFMSGLGLAVPAAALVFAVVLYLLYRQRRKPASDASAEAAAPAPKRNWFKIYLIAQAVSFPLMLVAARVLMGNIGNDYHILFDIALAHVDGQPCPWPFEYGQYPNNHLILMVMIYLFEAVRAIAPAASGTTLMWIHVILNVVCVQAALLLVAQTARQIFGPAKGALAGALMLLSVPVWINLQNAYSDTAGLLFVALQLRIVAHIWANPGMGLRSLACWSLALGAFAGIGFEIKATCAVVVVAAIVCAWVVTRPRVAAIVTAASVAACIACIAFTGALVDIVRPADLPYDEAIQDEFKYPYVHWLMMALNVDGEGAYYEDDYFFTRSFPTYAEKTAADKAVLAERLETLGVGGVLRQVAVAKPTTLWGYGALIRQYEYEALTETGGAMGAAYRLVLGFAQTCHLVMLCCIIAGACWLVARRRDVGEALAGFRRGFGEGAAAKAEGSAEVAETTLAHRSAELVFVITLFVAVFGLCAFLCGIWEVKPRYLVHVMPLFVMLETFGWGCLAQGFRRAGELDR